MTDDDPAAGGAPPIPGFGCLDVERFVDAYLDGEFATEDRGELERHVAACADCTLKVRYQANFRYALRAAAPRPAAPAEFRRRITAQIENAAGRRRTRVRRALLGGGVLVVAIAFGLGARSLRGARSSPLAVDVIAWHARQLPLEVAGDAAAVEAWFAGKVGFAVRPPRLPRELLLRGGRIANLREREAACLFYELGGEPVSLLVFSSHDLAIDAARRRAIGGRELFFDDARGYQVALFREGEIGYALVSRLDEARLGALAGGAAPR